MEGSVWVVNSQDASVSRIDPANDNVAGQIPVGNGPTSIAYGAGSVWVLNQVDATISRIAADSGRVTDTIPLGQNPTRLAFGLGYVWVTSEEAGVLLRIDPKTGSVVEATPVGNGPVGVAVGDNAVWVANTPDRTVTRVDPSSGAVTKLNLVDRPAEVTYADGTLWVANTLDGTLTRIDADSQDVGRPIRTVDNPAGLAPSGRNVWTIALTSSLAHRGGTLRIAAGTGDEAFDTPDPGAAYRAGSWQLAWIVYDGLVTYRRTGGPSGNTVVPDLATALPVIQDGGRTYVFKLRDGIRYSNGASVKASDLRHAIERGYREQTGFTGIAEISGCEQVHERRVRSLPRNRRRRRVEDDHDPPRQAGSGFSLQARAAVRLVRSARLPADCEDQGTVAGNGAVPDQELRAESQAGARAQPVLPRVVGGSAAGWVSGSLRVHLRARRVRGDVRRRVGESRLRVGAASTRAAARDRDALLEPRASVCRTVDVLLRPAHEAPTVRRRSGTARAEPCGRPREASSALGREAALADDLPGPAAGNRRLPAHLPVHRAASAAGQWKRPDLRTSAASDRRRRREGRDRAGCRRQ